MSPDPAPPIQAQLKAVDQLPGGSARPRLLHTVVRRSVEPNWGLWVNLGLGVQPVGPRSVDYHKSCHLSLCDVLLCAIPPLAPPSYLCAVGSNTKSTVMCTLCQLCLPCALLKRPGDSCAVPLPVLRTVCAVPTPVGTAAVGTLPQNTRPCEGALWDSVPRSASCAASGGNSFWRHPCTRAATRGVCWRHVCSRVQCSVARVEYPHKDAPCRPAPVCGRPLPLPPQRYVRILLGFSLTWAP